MPAIKPLNSSLLTKEPDEDAVDLPPLYYAGRTMDLKTSSDETIQVKVTRVISITMSPVLEVEMDSSKGLKLAILKLFDRRFGEARERHPWTPKAETSWQDCVRSGFVDKVLEDLQGFDDMLKNTRLDIDDDSGDEKDSDDDSDDEDSDDDDEDQVEEAIIYHKTQKHYRNEVRAYSELQSLQGKCIPKFFHSVIDNSPESPQDLPAAFFQVKGILLEYIPSFTLSDMTTRLPNQPGLWKSIVENSIRMVKEVNEAGIVHFDCQPRNVLVSVMARNLYRPFLIDFSQCGFKDDYRDTPDVSDEKGFSYVVHSSDNRGAIAVLMGQRVARSTPFRLEIERSLYLDQ